MLSRLLRSSPVQAAAARALSLYLRLALRSTRWTVHGSTHLQPHAEGRPAVVAFWHERLPLMPALFAEARRRGDPALRMCVLVSRHRDGRLIGSVIRRFGLDLLEGSSDRPGARSGRRGGAGALRGMLRALEGGRLVVITPDVPRGPRRVAATGVAQVAALVGVSVLPAAGQCSRRRVLGSWDRMVLPLPFGRGVLVCGRSIPVPRDGWAEALPRIEAALTEAAEQADRLCA